MLSIGGFQLDAVKVEKEGIVSLLTGEMAAVVVAKIKFQRLL